MQYLLIVLILCAALSCAAEAQAPEIARGFLMKTVSVDGKDLKYVVYVPPTYDPDKPCPTIVFLHGSGECGSDGLKPVAVGIGSAIEFHVNDWPFIVIFPQKQVTEHKWEEEDAMVMAIVDKTRKEYNVDASRIYLTGLSQGGHGSWSIGALHPDLFAAVAPICGWGDKEMAGKLVKMPVWVFHGEDDPVVKVQSARDMAKWIEEAGGSCKMTIYPGVQHNSWDKAYHEEKLYDWFMQYKKS